MLLLCLSLFQSLASAIWPIPTHYKHGDTVLCISKHFRFDWASKSDHFDDDGFYRYSWSEAYFQPQENESNHHKPPTREHIVRYAAYSAHDTIFNKNFVPWKFHPRSWTEPDLFNIPCISRVQLHLLQEDPEDVARPLSGSIDESYSLSLTEEGEATISANSSIGVVRGLATFTQLFSKHTLGAAYTRLAPVYIYDAPKFPHRGLNLDVSRHFFPVSDIMRTIDALAYAKMNRLHLHITDSQSWPLEIPSLAKLAEKGAFRPNLVYTVKDFEELQHHAAIQGVQLITEIDMPGHTSSIYHSYPDLVAAFDIQPDHYTYAAEPPSGTLKLNSTAVYEFLETLFDDLLPRITPYASYFHTGGDEVNKNAYLLDDTVRSKDFAVLQPLMQTFIDRNHEQLRKKGLTPVVWEEMLLEWDLKLGEDVVVQSWRSDEAVEKIVEKGHKVLVGNYKFWYLDCGKGQWLNLDSNDPGQYQDYCAPYHNWRAIYSHNPLTNIPTSKQHLVLGGEVHLWAEQTDPSNLDQMVWPRAAAAAEVLWSGAMDAEGNSRSQKEAAQRLSEMRERLVRMGVGAEPVQMPYCTMEGGCGA
ncbi:glycoside hydrolase family 20 protein [Lentithecium fluviatile CBS 122367]|uniref:Beta-hexosaminidase n=1 Tax=Lentithecium fluviatile CBS 122367 TaxID=1168545 RepID=A0A6G1JBP5_9PLEO|nr:glycoside hydrolase family 20 protein [Lentithecium fluviatile CBS 122367]